uniref:FAD dependent oxidoreductase domain-containing protein n=1 Tax=Mycena chlorophos TaxID=658473 RepID=A0ABQ0KXE6_MYCCL|nr:predicted protein [Mycena chlorophos]
MAAESPSNPGFPRPNPSISFWLQGTRSSALIGHRTTASLPEDVQDVVVIGGGFSGVATAYFLLKGKNPPARVTLLEAREVCDGATGRNGGHCRPVPFQSYARYKKSFGKEQALKIETLSLLTEIVHNEEIDCDFAPTSTYDILESSADAAIYASRLSEFAADGGKVDGIVEAFTTPAAARSETGTERAFAAYKWQCCSLWPYKLVAALAQVALSEGLNLQTNTAVRSVVCDEALREGERLWVLHTDRGLVKTRKVVYATNAHTATLLPELGGPIYPFKGHAVATKPFSGTMNRVQSSYNFTGDGGNYFFQRPKDGIFVVGGGRDAVNNDELLRTTDDGTVLPVAVQSLRETVQGAFGAERWGKEALGEGLLTAWSGIMGYSADSVPYVGPLHGKVNAFICAGHNGHGMARIMTCARGIAQLLEGATYAETGLPECFLPTKERLEKHALAKAPNGGK